MNLQENIHRIQSMMGVINEDNRPNVFKKMIDELGITNAIKMAGDYDLIDSHLTDKDKINYIKDEFLKVNDGDYFGMEQIWEKPIRIKVDDENRIHQIEGLHKDVVSVVKHKEHGTGVTSYYPKYEELSSETIDKLFRMMLSQYIKI